MAEYGPDLGLIVSGAHVYRGDAVPALRNLLVMTEWGFQSGGGALLAAPADGDPPWRPTRVRIDGGKPPGANYFWSLSRDADGELHVGTMAGRAPAERKGRLFRVVAV